MKNPKERTYRQQFTDTFKKLACTRHNAQVWADFVTLAACAISNSVDMRHYKEREDRYLSIISRYSKAECDMFSQLLAFTAQAMEQKPEQDFLGERFMLDLELGNKGTGQHFTPYSLGKCIAQIQSTSLAAEVEAKGYIAVNDCCCGAGCLLLAFANEALAQGINYQDKVLFVAQDIDYIVAMSCYIQLSLLGCAGYVIVGNTLSCEAPRSEDIWYTPMYFMPVWGSRRLAKQLAKSA